MNGPLWLQPLAKDTSFAARVQRLERGELLYPDMIELRDELALERKVADIDETRAMEEFDKWGKEQRNLDRLDGPTQKLKTLKEKLSAEQEKVAAVDTARTRLWEAEKNKTPTNGLEWNISLARGELVVAHSEEVKARTEFEAATLAAVEARAEQATLEGEANAAKLKVAHLRQFLQKTDDAVAQGEEAEKTRVFGARDSERLERAYAALARIEVPSEIFTCTTDALPIAITRFGAKRTTTPTAEHEAVALLAQLKPLRWRVPSNGLRTFVKGIMALLANGKSEIAKEQTRCTVGQFGRYKLEVEIEAVKQQWTTTILPIRPKSPRIPDSYLPSPNAILVLESLPAWNRFEAFEESTLGGKDLESVFWAELGKPSSTFDADSQAEIYAAFLAALQTWRSLGAYIRNGWKETHPKHTEDIQVQYLRGGMEYQKHMFAQAGGFPEWEAKKRAAREKNALAKDFFKLKDASASALKSEWDQFVAFHTQIVLDTSVDVAAAKLALTTLTTTETADKLAADATDLLVSAVVAELSTLKSELAIYVAQVLTDKGDISRYQAELTRIHTDVLPKARADESNTSSAVTVAKSTWLAYGYSDEVRLEYVANGAAASASLEFNRNPTSETRAAWDAARQTALDAKKARVAAGILDQVFNDTKPFYDAWNTASSDYQTAQETLRNVKKDITNMSEQVHQAQKAAESSEKQVEATEEEIKKATEREEKLDEKADAEREALRLLAVDIVKATEKVEAEETPAKDASNAADAAKIRFDTENGLKVTAAADVKKEEAVLAQLVKAQPRTPNERMAEKNKAKTDYDDAQHRGTAAAPPTVDVGLSYSADSSPSSPIELASNPLLLTQPSSPVGSTSMPRDLEAELSGEAPEFQLEYHREAFVAEGAMLFGSTPLDTTLPLFVVGSLNGAFNVDTLSLRPVSDWPPLDVELWKTVRANHPKIVDLLSQFEAGTAAESEMETLISADRLISIPKGGPATG